MEFRQFGLKTLTPSLLVRNVRGVLKFTPTRTLWCPGSLCSNITAKGYHFGPDSESRRKGSQDVR